MTTLLIATRNTHKVQEIRAILGDGFRYLTLNDFLTAPKVVEDANTFAGNATKKAVELARWLIETLNSELATRNSFVLADDSGLEVDALDGAPGVQSARFAALDMEKTGNSSDADNNAKLLRLLKDIPPERRTARFRCVIALAPCASEPGTQNTELGTRNAELFEGVCEGHIGFEPRGKNGFGYDPLFTPEGFNQTFAELGEDVKNKLSHRARALAKLKQSLQSAGQRG